MKTLRYLPTKERVEIVRIANEGQKRPEDPGRGVRLYVVKPLLDPRRNRATPDTWQAAADELVWEEDGRATSFTDAAYDAEREAARVERMRRIGQARRLRDAWALTGAARVVLDRIAGGENVDRSEVRAAVTALREGREMLHTEIDDLMTGHDGNS